jgi:hypothetical protein
MVGILIAVVLVAGVGARLEGAQIQDPIQAAKDAYKKAREQAKQQRNQQLGVAPQPRTQPGSQSANTSATTQPSGSSSGTAGNSAEPQAADAVTSDCCSAEAKKKIAESLSYLDIVGVKLGMTPKEAFAAIHAYNPKMKIDIINSRMEPPTAPGTFVRVPHYAIARIVGLPGLSRSAESRKSYVDYLRAVTKAAHATSPYSARLAQAEAADAKARLAVYGTSAVIAALARF